MVRVLIVAHFHEGGAIRSDTVNFLELAQTYFDRIVFVSTKLSLEYADCLPKKIKVFIKENRGYDFGSYKLGIQDILNDKDYWRSISQLTIFNTSFVIVNPNLLLNNYFRKVDCAKHAVGLTSSLAGFHPHHIQSYLITFQHSLLQEPKFIDWWNDVKPLRNKGLIISEYEVGLSRFIQEIGYEIDSLIKCSVSTCGSHNPSHHHFLEILENYGVLKIELFKKNPFKLNLRELNKKIKTDANLLQAIKDGFSN